MALYTGPSANCIRGLPVPSSGFFSVEKIKSAFNYTPKDGDTVVCTFPKTGTTWTQYIIWSIFHNADPMPDLNKMLHYSAPYIELAGAEIVDSLPPPRLFKTHLPYNHLNINKSSKYVYVYRHPRDTIVSMYHFSQDILQRELSFDEFFNNFLEGKVTYGNYFDHVLSFLDHRDEDHVHILTYEGLTNDKRSEILRLAKFLGKGYYQALVSDNELLERIIHNTTFENMKSTVRTNIQSAHDVQNTKTEARREINFFRKGIVGDGKSLLSAEQLSQLNKIIQQKMKGTKLLEEWLL